METILIVLLILLTMEFWLPALIIVLCVAGFIVALPVAIVVAALKGGR